MSAADAVWALVSGLPAGKRENQQFMVLQAFLDDSGSEPTSAHFTIAGFFADSAQWASFSDAWNDVLLQAPALQYLKMSEAWSMRGQFSLPGWTHDLRDQRILAFIRVINNHRFTLFTR